MIKAVIFDVDGVLLDSFEANLKFFQDLMAQNGYAIPTRKEFRKIFHLTMMEAIKALTKASENEVKRIWEIGNSREVKYHVEMLRLPDGAKNVLEKLDKKYRLGIVTGRIRKSVFEAPQLAQLRHYFPVVVSYDDTVRHKPDPQPLIFASKKLELNPNECVYVGDAQSDIAAAHSAGMKVIIYSNGMYSDADMCTSDFAKIPELIKAM